jgi:hypothetical protein
MHRDVEYMWMHCGVSVEAQPHQSFRQTGHVQNFVFFHDFFPLFSQWLSTAKNLFHICAAPIFHTFHTTNNNLNFYQITCL